jgi:hypothetical protein
MLINYVVGFQSWASRSGAAQESAPSACQMQKNFGTLCGTPGDFVGLNARSDGRINFHFGKALTLSRVIPMTKELRL